MVEKILLISNLNLEIIIVLRLVLKKPLFLFKLKSNLINLRYSKLLFLFLFLISFSFNGSSQKVGLVLSGGGATGLAHVGVLMALEEAEIPIDYITGTSAGALVGAMYASGYSPEEIKAYILSDDFIMMGNGELSKDKTFLLRSDNVNSSMINVPFSTDSIFQKSLPTNFMTPAFLDFEMLRVFGATSAAVNEDFDQLFVPFRCVASDITKKESVVFGRGKLNLAVRASMTYPFYINPVRVDGVLLFDGGLYNNFPSDVMCESFDADYLIGSNVSYNAAPPQEDDLISQVTNMLVTPSSFELQCKEGVVISPQTDIGTFDFSSANIAIRAGYLAGLSYVDSIRQKVTRTVSKEEVQQRRDKFRSGISEIRVSSVTAKNKEGKRIDFIEKSIIKDSFSETLDFDKFTKRYFRAYSTPQIKYLYPTIELQEDSTHALNIELTKEKPFILSVGGHFSSRPVNTGYIGLSYLGLSDGAIKINGESYFGKFYGSTSVKIDFDVPSTYPFRISPYFTMNRWDYFRSLSTFFEDVKPSFLVQNEMYYGTKFGVPVGNRLELDLDFRAFENRDEYYQSQNFTNADTADVTRFDGQTASIAIVQNNLNRKQWASAGSYFKSQFRYVQGREQSVSGSTAPLEYDVRKVHQWLNLKVEGQYFPLSKGLVKLGVHGQTVFNSQSLFANYTASILNMTEFSPLPDSRTLFMEDYRAPQYVGGGINIIASLSEVIDLRFDPYYFQPFRQIVRFDNGNFGYSDTEDLLDQGVLMAAASVIYHSPIGPLRFTTNYFPQENKPFAFQLSFGYVLFNERAIR